MVVARSGGFSEIVVAQSGGISEIAVARSGGFEETSEYECFSPIKSVLFGRACRV